MEKEILIKLKEKLQGLNWCFTAGLALKIYTNRKRKVRDIDILVKEIDVFAKRLGCKAHKRKFKKATFIVEDYGFQTKFLGKEIEASSGFPFWRMQNKTIEKVYKNKVKKNFLGVEVFVEPIEELIVHKADMAREKDINDLKLLKKTILKERKINVNLLREFARDWQNYDKIMQTLRKIGYNL